ncbi:hypothetical protein K1X84_02730 [bacterium]|nr:hypothetical protein [bacterium]
MKWMMIAIMLCSAPVFSQGIMDAYIRCYEEMGNEWLALEIVVEKDQLDIRHWKIEYRDSSEQLMLRTFKFSDDIAWEKVPSGTIIRLTRFAELSEPDGNEINVNTGDRGNSLVQINQSQQPLYSIGSTSITLYDAKKAMDTIVLRPVNEKLNK